MKLNLISILLGDFYEVRNQLQMCGHLVKGSLRHWGSRKRESIEKMYSEMIKN